MSQSHAHAHGNSCCHDHEEAPPTENTGLLSKIGSTVHSMLTHSHSHGSRFAFCLIPWHFDFDIIAAVTVAAEMLK
jgi:hypothetical protein